MTSGDWIRLAIALVAVGVIAFATAVLIGYAASSNTRISELATGGSHSARTVEGLLDRSHHLQATMIVLDTTAVATASAMMTRTAIGNHSHWAMSGIIIASVAFMLIFGRAIPRAVALRLPDDVALSCARLARVAVILLSPLTALLDGITAWVIHVLKIPARSPNAAVATEEELIQLVRDEAGDNRIEAEEVNLIDNIFQFTDTTVRDVMAPRVDMAGVPRNATVRDAVTVVLEQGHSRLPVYDGSLDRIVGIIYAKDLLRFVGRTNANTSIVAVMRPPIYVPEGKPVLELLRELQARRIHIAIVVDEYGGTAGLVTIEDILEEIVGDIQDEYDTEATLVEPEADGVYVVNARLELSDFNQLMDVQWGTEEQQREPFAGFIYDYLGRIPAEDEDIWIDDIKLTVMGVENQRLSKLRVERIPRYEPAESEAVPATQNPVPTETPTH